MLCISFSSSTIFEQISYQLRYYHPKIYSENNYNIAKTSNFSLLIDKSFYSGQHIINFVSRYNQYLFTHFAKSYNWQYDLYETIVSPYFRSAFAWETWRRSPAEPSFCYPEYTWTEINVMKVQFENDANLSFAYTKDHSKIGIALPNNTFYKQIQTSQNTNRLLSYQHALDIDATFNKYACVGDLNRMYSQEDRGGGTACLINANFWQILKYAFIEYESCST